MPEHPPPDQPVNVEPEKAVAVSVTWVPSAYCAEHVPGHEIPTGELSTVPNPGPVTLTLSVCCGGGAGWNVAVTD
jgi:hypothetical protein